MFVGVFLFVVNDPSWGCVVVLPSPRKAEPSEVPKPDIPPSQGTRGNKGMVMTVKAHPKIC